jgi:hypothetical protein
MSRASIVNATILRSYRHARSGTDEPVAFKLPSSLKYLNASFRGIFANLPKLSELTHLIVQDLTEPNVDAFSRCFTGNIY